MLDIRSASWLLAVGLALPAHAQSYLCRVDQPASSAAYSMNLGAPFLPAPNPIPAVQPPNISYLIGGAELVPPSSPATRTRPGSGFGTFTGNNPVPITAGSFSATGPASPVTLRPSGSFVAYFIGNRVAIVGLSLDLLGGATSTVNTNVGLTYVTFRTNSPTSLFPLPGATINVPLGTAAITSVVATQVDAFPSGPATQTGPNEFSFSVPLTVRLQVAATLSDNPLPFEPLDLPLTITGTITQGPGTISVDSTVALTSTAVQPGPTPLDPAPFDEPIFGGKLAAIITLGDTTINFSSNAQLVAPSVESYLPPDYNRDTVVNQEDLSAFITDWLAEPPIITADYNLDEIVDQEDLGPYITDYFLYAG